jgi:hypothetical protein
MEGLEMEVVDLFYGHLVYYVHTWSFDIFWTFGILYGISVYFPHFGMLYEEKSGNPG